MDRETEGTGGQVFTGEESTPLWAHMDLLERGDMGTTCTCTFNLILSPRENDTGRGQWVQCNLCPSQSHNGRGHWVQCNLCPSISSGVQGHSWGQVSAQLLDNPHSVREFLGEFVCVHSKCSSLPLFPHSDHS